MVTCCWVQAHEDENVRAIVLGGSGKHFTSGLDLTDSGVKLMELIEAPGPDVARRAFKLEGLIRRFVGNHEAGMLVPDCGDLVQQFLLTQADASLLFESPPPGIKSLLLQLRSAAFQ